MNDILLERATEQDIETLLRLGKDAASKTYAAILDKEQMLKELADDFIYLIKKDNVIVGMVDYKLMESNKAYLSELVIDKPFQGQGIAKRALQQVLDLLPEVKQFELYTHPENVAAIKTYLSLGFIIKSWKENYYGDGEPRIGMTRLIP